MLEDANDTFQLRLPGPEKNQRNLPPLFSNIYGLITTLFALAPPRTKFKARNRIYLQNSNLMVSNFPPPKSSAWRKTRTVDFDLNASF
jgi:hypothetical protein